MPWNYDARIALGLYAVTSDNNILRVRCKIGKFVKIENIKFHQPSISNELYKQLDIIQDEPNILNATSYETLMVYNKSL